MLPFFSLSSAPALLLAGALMASAPLPETESGVVTSEAVSVAGHDFCQYFIAAWRDKEGSERFTIAIRERPSARWGSEVWIEFSQRQVLHLRLPAARAAMRPLGEEAAESAYQAVLEADLQRKFVNDADLASDEI